MFDLSIVRVAREPVPPGPVLFCVDGYKVTFACGCEADCEVTPDPDCDFAATDGLLGTHYCATHEHDPGFRHICELVFANDGRPHA